MKIVHPVAGYNGYVSGPRNWGLHFLAGVAHAKADDIPAKARKQWESDGFQFTDERRQSSDATSGGDEPAE